MLSSSYNPVRSTRDHEFFRKMISQQSEHEGDISVQLNGKGPFFPVHAHLHIVGGMLSLYAVPSGSGPVAPLASRTPLAVIPITAARGVTLRGLVVPGRDNASSSQAGGSAAEDGGRDSMQVRRANEDGSSAAEFLFRFQGAPSAELLAYQSQYAGVASPGTEGVVTPVAGASAGAGSASCSVPSFPAPVATPFLARYKSGTPMTMSSPEWTPGVGEPLSRSVSMETPPASGAAGGEEDEDLGDGNASVRSEADYSDDSQAEYSEDEDEEDDDDGARSVKPRRRRDGGATGGAARSKAATLHQQSQLHPAKQPVTLMRCRVVVGGLGTSALPGLPSRPALPGLGAPAVVRSMTGGSADTVSESLRKSKELDAVRDWAWALHKALRLMVDSTFKAMGAGPAGSVASSSGGTALGLSSPPLTGLPSSGALSGGDILAARPLVEAGLRGSLSGLSGFGSSSPESSLSPSTGPRDGFGSAGGGLRDALSSSFAPPSSVSLLSSSMPVRQFMQPGTAGGFGIPSALPGLHRQGTAAGGLGQSPLASLPDDEPEAATQQPQHPFYDNRRSLRGTLDSRGPVLSTGSIGSIGGGERGPLSPLNEAPGDAGGWFDGGAAPARGAISSTSSGRRAMLVPPARGSALSGSFGAGSPGSSGLVVGSLPSAARPVSLRVSALQGFPSRPAGERDTDSDSDGVGASPRRQAGTTQLPSRQGGDGTDDGSDDDRSSTAGSSDDGAFGLMDDDVSKASGRATKATSAASGATSARAALQPASGRGSASEATGLDSSRLGAGSWSGLDSAASSSRLTATDDASLASSRAATERSTAPEPVAVAAAAEVAPAPAPAPAPASSGAWVPAWKRKLMAAAAAGQTNEDGSATVTGTGAAVTVAAPALPKRIPAVPVVGGTWGVWSEQGVRSRMEDAHVVLVDLKPAEAVPPLGAPYTHQEGGTSGSGSGGAAANAGAKATTSTSASHHHHRGASSGGEGSLTPHGHASSTGTDIIPGPLPGTCSYYAVFDGHFGRYAADFASDRLHHHLAASPAFKHVLQACARAQAAAAANDETANTLMPDPSTLPPALVQEVTEAFTTSLRQSFLATDAEFLALGEAWTGPAARPARYDAGSTALAVLRAGCFLAVASLGDTRAVLCRGSKLGVRRTTAGGGPLPNEKLPTTLRAEQVGSEQTPQSEQPRIVAAGGWVVIESEMSLGRLDHMDLLDPWVQMRARTQAVKWSTVSRVNGELGVSRAIGDADYKGTRKDVYPWPWPRDRPANTRAFSADLVIADPEVTVLTLSPDDAFVVLACDGVWDVLSPQDAADIVWDVLRPAAQAAAAGVQATGTAPSQDGTYAAGPAAFPEGAPVCFTVPASSTKRSGGMVEMPDGSVVYPATPEAAAQRLVQMALKLGSSDNCTAMVVVL